MPEINKKKKCSFAHDSIYPFKTGYSNVVVSQQTGCGGGRGRGSSLPQIVQRNKGVERTAADDAVIARVDNHANTLAPGPHGCATGRDDGVNCGATCCRHIKIVLVQRRNRSSPWQLYLAMAYLRGCRQCPGIESLPTGRIYRPSRRCFPFKSRTNKRPRKPCRSAHNGPRSKPSDASFFAARRLRSVYCAH